jgi:hypothetical protein
MFPATRVLGDEIRVRWPAWMDWELELSMQVRKRMEDRGFTEIDLREMMTWKVVVEPDPFTRKLVMITAYPVW